MAEGSTLASGGEGKQLLQKTVPCSLCEDGSVVYCQTCRKHLCVDCRSSHKKQRKSKTHKVVDLFHKANTSQVRCELHRDHYVRYFCESCSDICCEQCKDDEHKTHIYHEAADCIEKIQDLCIQQAHDLRTPYMSMKNKLNGIREFNTERMARLSKVKQEVRQREETINEIVNSLADIEIDEIEKLETETETFVASMESNLERHILKCKETLSPVMSLSLGQDVQQLISAILNIRTQSRSVQAALTEVDKVKDMGTLEIANGEVNMDTFKYETSSILKVKQIENTDSFNSNNDDAPGNESCDLVTLQPVKNPDIHTTNSSITNVNEQTNKLDDINIPKHHASTANTQELDSGTPEKSNNSSISKSESMDNADSDTTQDEPNISEFIALKHISTSCIPGTAIQGDFAYISPRVHPEGFLSQTGPQARFVELDYLGRPTVYKHRLPKPRCLSGIVILSVKPNRHILVSNKAIHLYNKDREIKYVRHKDGHLPGIITYVNGDCFATFCFGQKNIMYHCVETLEPISSHRLTGIDDIKISSFHPRFLVTKKHDILIAGCFKWCGMNRLFRFTETGSFKEIVPVEDTIWSCDFTTMCMAGNDQILGAQGGEPGTIHMFGLNGEHNMIGTIPGSGVLMYSMGVSEENVFVTYWWPTQAFGISKYGWVSIENSKRRLEHMQVNQTGFYDHVFFP